MSIPKVVSRIALISMLIGSFVYGSESEDIRAFFDTAFEDELSRHPMQQSYLGIKTNNHKWDDLSDSAARREYMIATQLLTTLRTEFDFGKLAEQDKLSYRLFELRCQRVIDDFPWRFHSYPINQMFGWQSRIPAFLINIHGVSNLRDAEAYVARLRGVRPLMSQVVDQLELRRTKGIIVPKFVFPLALNDCRNLLKGHPFEKTDSNSTLLADFKEKVNGLKDVDETTKQRLVNMAVEALVTDVKPAYEHLVGQLTQLSAQATNDDGAWKFPSGDAFYQRALTTTTTTELTPSQIHNLGLAEVKRIHNEMRAIMKKVKFEGDLQAFFDFTRDDPQFYYANDDAGRDQYLKQATQLIDVMRGRLDELFLTKPRADMIVKRVEPFREDSAGKAFYQPPAPDGSRPGTYYANLNDMADMPIYQMEALAYHEGIPGHHMQLTIAQELEDLPRFRRFGTRYTAYSEGWGLYSELVPKEIGFYTDPYSDFGRLAMELWRACRLVVDTGIHAKRWPREQAIDYLVENTPNPKGDCVNAINRYIVMPGQATAYKIGMIRIFELRNMAKDELAHRFDIRRFHDVVLRNGPVPLTILEQQVRSWVAREKATVTK